MYDKAVVRLLEIGQSLDLIEKCLYEMPDGEITSFPKIPALLAHLKKAEGRAWAGTRPRGGRSSTTSASKRGSRNLWPGR